MSGADTGHAAGRRAALGAAAAVTAVYLVTAILLLPAFGPTWDAAIGEYSAGDKLVAWFSTGDEAFLDVHRELPRPEVREPHPHFLAGGGFPLSQVSMLNSIASGVACRVLWTELGLLPAMAAHHFANVAFVALLAFVLVAVVGRRFGVLAGVLAGGFLLTCPRFFSHSFNNPKDPPETCLYALAALASYAAMRRPRLGAWALAGGVAGLALASKPNAMFLPFQMLIPWGACAAIPSARGRLRVAPAGLALAAVACVVAFVAVSPDVWRSGQAAVVERYVAITGVGHRGHGVALHGLTHFVWTTPLSVLLFALLGVVARELRTEERVFLACGIAVPVGRTLLPGMLNFDGVRHFLEFMPFLAGAAGIGAAWFAHRFARGRASLAIALGAVLLVPSGVAVARTFPNGVCYFNAFVGGLAGAQTRDIPGGATDYWGNSYWQGLDWLAAHAAAGDRLAVPLAGHLVAAAAPVKLDPRIELLGDATPVDFDRPTWVMYVTREGSYDAFLRLADRTIAPEHTIEVQGGTILKILRLVPGDPEAVAAWAVRADRVRQNAAQERLESWVLAHPEHAFEVTVLLDGLGGPDPDAAERRLRALLAEDLPAELDAIVARWRRQ